MERMSRRIAIAATGLCAFGLVGACGRDGASSAPPGGGTPGAQGGATQGPTNVATAAVLRGPSNRGSFVAELVPASTGVPMNEPFGVELRLFERDGTTPYEPEQVTLDARMEEHEHGMLRDVELERVGSGRWRAEGLLFHMVGLWQFQIDVREGARIERAQLDLRLQ